MNLPDSFYDFYELGIGIPIPISAANMLNFGDVLDEIVESFPEGAGEDDEDDIKFKEEDQEVEEAEVEAGVEAEVEIEAKAYKDELLEEINKVRKSFEETIHIAPKRAVNNNAWKV